MRITKIKLKEITGSELTTSSKMWLEKVYLITSYISCLSFIYLLSLLQHHGSKTCTGYDYGSAHLIFHMVSVSGGMHHNAITVPKKNLWKKILWRTSKRSRRITWITWNYLLLIENVVYISVLIAMPLIVSNEIFCNTSTNWNDIKAL